MTKKQKKCDIIPFTRGSDRMNLVETLQEEMKGKHWNEEEKQRYIYIRCCQIFSYDITYNYLGYLTTEKSFLESERLKRRYIDILNVKNPLVVCTNFSQTLQKLYEQLLGIPSKLMGTHHVTLTLNHKTYGTITLDPVLSYDFARAKKHMYLKGSSASDFTKNILYHCHLQKVDEAIGYIKDSYVDANLKSQVDQWIQSQSLKNKDDILSAKMQFLKEKMQMADFQAFSDYVYYQHILRECICTEAEKGHLQAYPLCDFQKDNWQFYEIYKQSRETNPLYYILQTEKGKIQYHEIDKEEVEKIIKDLKGSLKKYILKP